MKFLDERIIFQVDWGSSSYPAAGMYTYTLIAYDLNTPEEAHDVFIGNFYYKSGRYILLDMTDIIRNSVISSDNIYSKLVEPEDYVNQSIKDELITEYWVKVNFNGTVKTSASQLVANVYRYYNGSKYNRTLDGQVTFFDPETLTTKYELTLQGYAGVNKTRENAYDLIPHYPLKSTLHLAFAATFICGTALGGQSGSYFQVAYLNDDASYEDFINWQIPSGTTYAFTKVASIAELLEGFFYDLEEYGYTGNVKIMLTYNQPRYPVIAIFDECYSRFYLQWRDRFGSYQCQPLYEVETYSENILTEEALSYSDVKKTILKQVQPKWKMNTGWLSDKVVPYYESIFVSPILILYDSAKDKSYEVCISDNFVEKNYNNQKGLVNIELNLEATNKLNIIY